MVEAIKVSLATCSRLHEKNDGSGSELHVRWQPPSQGEVALNSDGSVVNAGSNAACGGVLRDETGNFIFGFAVNSGACSIIATKLWGIYHGLRIAWDRGFRHIRVYCDS